MALRELAQGPTLWGVPVFVIAEFLRVATHPRVFEQPLTMSEATDVISRLLDSPTARILSPGDRYWRVFQESLLGSGRSTATWCSMPRSWLCAGNTVWTRS